MLTSLLAFLIAFGALLLLERLVHRRLQEVALLITGHVDAGVYLYSIPLLPGVALHEVSHAAMARLLGVKVRKLSLLPERQRGGTVRLGSVEVLRSDSLRSSLIGAAPLIAGLLALVLISRFAFDGSKIVSALESGDLGAIVTSIVDTRQAPDALIWFFIIFAVANSMMPSPSDVQSWPPVIGCLAILSAIALFLGGTNLIAAVSPTAQFTLRWLAAVLAITAFVDAVVIVLLWLLARILELITKRKIEYK